MVEFSPWRENPSRVWITSRKCMTESDPSDFIDTFLTCLSLLTDATMKRIYLLFYVSFTDIETKFVVSFMAVNITDANTLVDKSVICLERGYSLSFCAVILRRELTHQMGHLVKYHGLFRVFFAGRDCEKYTLRQKTPPFSEITLHRKGQSRFQPVQASRSWPVWRINLTQMSHTIMY